MFWVNRKPVKSSFLFQFSISTSERWITHLHKRTFAGQGHVHTHVKKGVSVKIYNEKEEEKELQYGERVKGNDIAYRDVPPLQPLLCHRAKEPASQHQHTNVSVMKRQQSWALTMQTYPSPPCIIHHTQPFYRPAHPAKIGSTFYLSVFHPLPSLLSLLPPFRSFSIKLRRARH